MLHHRSIHSAHRNCISPSTCATYSLQLFLFTTPTTAAPACVVLFTDQTIPVAIVNIVYGLLFLASLLKTPHLPLSGPSFHFGSLPVKPTSQPHNNSPNLPAHAPGYPTKQHCELFALEKSPFHSSDRCLPIVPRTILPSDTCVYFIRTLTRIPIPVTPPCQP